MSAILTRPGSENITFAVSDVELASDPLRTTKPQQAMESLVGGSFEAVCDYVSEYVDGISTHPLATAVKLAHDQHRPLVLSPDMIWLALCQAAAIHIEEHWSDLGAGILTSETRNYHIPVSTADFPFGSPENPWHELVQDAADQARALVVEKVASLFELSFSTTGTNEKAAMNVAFLSVVNRVLPIYDHAIVCGIPEITLRGTPDDWDKIATNVQKLSGVGLASFAERLKPILAEFTRAARGEVTREFWQTICSTDNATCGDERITGWISNFFPYLHRQEEGVSPNEGLTGGDAPAVADFPSGMREVSLRSQRGSTVKLLGGFTGIGQNAETLALEPQLGWAVQRHSPMDDLLETIIDHDCCEHEIELEPVRHDVGVRCGELQRFYQRLRRLRITSRTGAMICDFKPAAEMGEPPTRKIATLADGRWLAAVSVIDFRQGAIEGLANGKTAYFVGDEGTDPWESHQLVGDRLVPILEMMLESATADQPLELQPWAVLTPVLAGPVWDAIVAHNEAADSNAETTEGERANLD